MALNGKKCRSKDAEEFKKMVQKSSRPMTITVEHPPDATKKGQSQSSEVDESETESDKEVERCTQISPK